MPGAETRNLGSEGPVHVSVAEWVVGAMVHVGTGLGAGGIWAEGTQNHGGSQQSKN